MNTATTTSLIERLLPPTQKREWTLHKQTFGNDEHKFQKLLTYLLKEKNAIEYMNSDIRDFEAEHADPKGTHGVVNFTEIAESTNRDKLSSPSCFITTCSGGVDEGNSNIWTSG